MEGRAVTPASLPEDPLWPRAGAWISPIGHLVRVEADLAILGVPAFRTSITATGAHSTPAAVREALYRYSTWAGSRGVDVSVLRAVDLGDVTEPDGPEGEARVSSAAARAAGTCELLVAVGGDNSATFPVVRGLFGPDLAGCGLVTIDAHHDLRDGQTNGSPVRRVLEAGLPGSSVVQVGIADFSNSAAYAERARECGISVVPRSAVRGADITSVVTYAVDVASGEGRRPVFVDIDVDVCDRAEVPGCPSAAPGGISADELRQIAYACGQDPRVRGLDITEIDATIDAPDMRTVRLAALLVLEAAAGLCVRAGYVRVGTRG
jgi:formiminoglutamase